MSDSKHIRWLLDELPRLVDGGVVDADAADRLRGHYGPLPVRKPGAVLLLVFGVLGTALVGLGITLILANNWDDLSRTVRAGITFALLIGGQALVAFTLWRHQDSPAWRESAALFSALTVGAAIAMIGQTYNIPGDLGSFLLTWMLLIFPLMYLLDAGIVTIGYLAGLTWWSGYVQSQELHALWFYPAAALAVPHLVLTARREPHAGRTVWMLWAACLSATVAAGLTLEKSLPGLWIPLYTSLFATMYLGGAFWSDPQASSWRRPLHSFGAVALGVLLLILTFEDVWSSIGWNHYRTDEGYFGYAAIADYIATAALLLAAILLLVTAVRRGRSDYIPLGAAPILATAGFAVGAAADDPAFPWLAVNVYVLGVAVFTIARGLRMDRLDSANAGLGLAAALIMIRFFDSSLPFVARGLAFIVVGAGFLLCNFLIVRRRRQSA